jgi:hypothetical protein
VNTDQLAVRPDLETQAREWLATNADFVLVHPGGAVTSLAALLEQAEARGRAPLEAQLAELREAGVNVLRSAHWDGSAPPHTETVAGDVLVALEKAIRNTPQAAAAAFEARVRAKGAAESNEDGALCDRLAALLTRTAAAAVCAVDDALAVRAAVAEAERDAWRAADDKQAELVWSAVGDTSAWTARIVEARRLRRENEERVAR